MALTTWFMCISNILMSCFTYNDLLYFILVVHGDITNEHTDAIVNAANGQLNDGGGVSRFYCY